MDDLFKFDEAINTLADDQNRKGSSNSTMADEPLDVAVLDLVPTIDGV